MRLASLPPSIALTGAVLLALTGCFGSEPTLVPAPESTTVPIFASDEVALAAAEEAYAAYIAVSDQITAEGGANPERIAEYVTDSYRTSAILGFAPYREQQLHTAGASKFDSVVLQQVDGDVEGSVVAVYLCLDITDVVLLSADGLDATPAGRTNRLPLEVDFVASSSSALLVERSDLWTGDDFCE